MVISILDVITGKHPGRAERTWRGVSMCSHNSVTLSVFLKVCSLVSSSIKWVENNRI